ncbi:MAG TPA: DUF4411 family protein [Pyrinomonadaceae bacterium]
MPSYCFDTSAFMQSWRDVYPRDVFPSIWKRMEAWCGDETIVAPMEVRRELVKQEDDLAEWVKARPNGLFYPTDEELWHITAEVMALPEFQRIIETGRHGADPWVVGLARLTNTAVVTEEGRRRRPNIPAMCEDFGVRSITTLGFLREMGVRL